MGELFFILALFCLCYQEELTKEWFEFCAEKLLDKIQTLLLDIKLLPLERDFLVAKYKEMFAEVESSRGKFFSYVFLVLPSRKASATGTCIFFVQKLCKAKKI